MHVPGSRLGEYRTRWTFTDSVRMNLAAVLKKKRGASTESYRHVFNTFPPHFDMHIYRFFSWQSPHSKISNTSIFFTNVISKITNSGKNNYFLVFVILEHLPYSKPNAVNPPPQWCSWWNLIMIGPPVFRDIHVWKCERTDARTDGRTLARVPYYKLTLSLRLWWAKNFSNPLMRGGIIGTHWLPPPDHF